MDKNILSALQKNGAVKISFPLKVPIPNKWNKLCNPLKFNYYSAKVPKKTKNELSAILNLMLGKRKYSFSLYKFNSGCYTVLSDRQKGGNGILVILELTKHWNESWGGYTSFVSNGKEVHRIIPEKNTLFIINQQNLKSFVKYVNHNSKGSRIFLTIEMH